MKRFNFLLIAVLAFSLAACSKPKPVSVVEEIGPNETAFLIALDGNTVANQKKFDSVEALNQPEVKVAVKRVIIPQKVIDICPDCSDGADKKWQVVPTAKLIKINRAMVSREWTSSKEKGTTAQNQAITVETNESIDFDLGAVITAQIEEANAALFLYTYGGKQLDAVIDSDIRNYVAQSLSSSFGTHNLEQGRHDKILYFQAAFTAAKEFFKTKGITILTFGSTEGMTYKDESIQRAINKKFEAQMANEAADDMAKAASKLVSNRDAVILQQNYEIRKQEVENQKAAIAKWNGVGATVMTQGGTGQMFNIPVTVSPGSK
jgi:hypothetical protein